jgi:hypothetical protein
LAGSLPQTYGSHGRTAKWSGLSVTKESGSRHVRHCPQPALGTEVTGFMINQSALLLTLPLPLVDESWSDICKIHLSPRATNV